MSEKKALAPKEGISCDQLDEKKYEINTSHCGILHIIVQGNVSALTKTTPVFLTVHDLGCNHADFHHFLEHPSMAKVKERSVFIHVEIPGQELDAPDLPDEYNFPSMQEISEDLLTVMDYFKVQYAVTLGEGAGANILTRFAMAYPDRVLGNILIHCTSTVAGIMEYFNDKIIGWKLQAVGMNPTAEEYLVFHKFGTMIEQQIENAENKDSVLKEFINKLQCRINPRNLRLYVEAFLNRTDLSGILMEKMKLDTLLVTGAKASHLHTVHTMRSHMDPRKTTLLTIDDVGDVLYEAPEKLAYNLILFCQGLGLLSSLSITRQPSY